MTDAKATTAGETESGRDEPERQALAEIGRARNRARDTHDGHGRHMKINARALDPALIGEKADVIVVDVSFISIEKILPALVPIAHSETDWITLIKPQFEVGRDNYSQSNIASGSFDFCVSGQACFTSLPGVSGTGSPFRGTASTRSTSMTWRALPNVNSRSGVHSILCRDSCDAEVSLQDHLAETLS